MNWQGIHSMEDLTRDIEGLYSYIELIEEDFCILLENEQDMFYWKKVFCNSLNNHSIGFYSMASFPYLSTSERGKDSLIKFLKEVNECYSEIEKKELSLFIAWDSDYDIFKSDEIRDSIVIDTYGYTIENSLFCPNRIAKIIMEDIPLNDKYYIDIYNRINDWYISLDDRLRDFVIMNIAASLMKETDEDVPKVMGRCADVYMNNNRTDIDDDKVSKKVIEINKLIPEEFVNRAKDLLISSEKDMRLIISGHFLEKLVQRKVEQVVKENRDILRKRENSGNISLNYKISIEDLLKRANDKCKSYCPNRIDCSDFKHTNLRIKDICK